jgi:hypothetical protein
MPLPCPVDCRRIRDGDADAPGCLRRSGDRREPRFALDEQVIGLAVGQWPIVTEARDVTGDELRVPLPQRCGSETGTGGGPGREVLHEHVRAGDDLVQEPGIGRRLDVQYHAFLASVQPDEVRRFAVHDTIVVTREVPLRPLDLDDAGTGLGEPQRAQGRRHGLFECNHQHAIERARHQRGRSIRRTWACPGHGCRHGTG